MSLNVLTELIALVGSEKAEEKIIEVISYDSLSGKVEYKFGAKTGTFVSNKAYSPGDNLVMSGDSVIGIAESISNTVWID